MKENREELIVEFLNNSKLQDCTREKLPCDASARSYERIKQGEKTFILMNAPSPENEKIKAFATIDSYLRDQGLSAPEIFSYDAENGFMLLEDLGNDSFTNVLKGNSTAKEKELYIAAIDALSKIDQSKRPKDTADYDFAMMMRECKLLTEWYLPNLKGANNIDKAAGEYSDIWSKMLQKFEEKFEKTLVLRDYHADNLLWLPTRDGVKNVGLLDFQDAVIGSPIYDIVSLLEDARRDVSPETVNDCINHFLSLRSDLNRDDFMLVYSILGAQRNSKIIGIFARLAIRDGKKRYLDYLPRVWAHLHRDLTHPALAPVKTWINHNIPQELQDPSHLTIPKQEKAVG